eukprot:EG_transcript_51793
MKWQLFIWHVKVLPVQLRFPSPGHAPGLFCTFMVLRQTAVLTPPLPYRALGIQLNPRSHWPSSHPVEPIAPSLAHPKNKMRPAAPHKCTRTNRIFASGLNTLASPRAP